MFGYEFLPRQGSVLSHFSIQREKAKKCNLKLRKRKSHITHVFTNILIDFKRSAPVETKSLCKLLLHANMFLKINPALSDYVSKKKKYALSYYLMRTSASRVDREESKAVKNKLDLLKSQLSNRRKSAGKMRKRKGKELKKCKKKLFCRDLKLFAAIKTNILSQTRPRGLLAKKVTTYSESSQQRNARCKVEVSCNRADPLKIITLIMVISMRVRIAVNPVSVLSSYYQSNPSILIEARLSKRK